MQLGLRKGSASGSWRAMGRSWSTSFPDQPLVASVDWILSSLLILSLLHPSGRPLPHLPHGPLTHLFHCSLALSDPLPHSAPGFVSFSQDSPVRQQREEPSQTTCFEKCWGSFKDNISISCFPRPEKIIVLITVHFRGALTTNCTYVVDNFLHQ